MVPKIKQNILSLNCAYSDYYTVTVSGMKKKTILFFRLPKQENKQSLCIQILIDSFLLYTRVD